LFEACGLTGGDGGLDEFGDWQDGLVVALRRSGWRVAVRRRAVCRGVNGGHEPAFANLFGEGRQEQCVWEFRSAAGFGEYESSVSWREEQGFEQSKLWQWIEVTDRRGDGGEFREFDCWLWVVEQQDAGLFQPLK
jgi:hypothetical protein